MKSSCLFCVVGLLSAMASCSKSDSVKGQAFLSEEGSLIAPDNVVGIHFDGYPEDGVEVSINNFSFDVGLSHEPYLIPSYEKSNEAWDYINNRLTTINERIKDESPDLYYGPVWFDCRISSAVRIEANCTLFGKEAGSNLIEFFDIKDLGLHSRVICTYPDYSPVKTLPNNKPLDTNLNEYLAPGNALPNFTMKLCLKSIPAERPEQLTLTMQIPISYDSWRRFSWIEGTVHFGTDRVLEGSINIHFIY